MTREKKQVVVVVDVAEEEDKEVTPDIASGVAAAPIGGVSVKEKGVVEWKHYGDFHSV